MAITTGFKFTNTTATTSKAVALFDMKELHSYTCSTDEPGNVVLDNKTNVAESSELLKYRGKYIDHVKTDLSLPADSKKVQKGVQFAIQIEDDLVTEDASIGFRQDDPIVMYLTVNMPNSQYITDAALGATFQRLCSQLQDEAGNWRFSDLRRLGLRYTTE